jgi:hypothetical protein
MHSPLLKSYFLRHDLFEPRDGVVNELLLPVPASVLLGIHRARDRATTTGEGSFLEVDGDHPAAYLEACSAQYQRRLFPL